MEFSKQPKNIIFKQVEVSRNYNILFRKSTQVKLRCLKLVQPYWPKLLIHLSEIKISTHSNMILKEHDFKAWNFSFTKFNPPLPRKNSYSVAIYVSVWKKISFWGGHFFSILCGFRDNFLTAVAVAPCVYRPFIFKELMHL